MSFIHTSRWTLYKSKKIDFLIKHWVAKCQLFYTKQNIENQISPQEICIFWYFKWTLIIKNVILEYKHWKLYHIRQVITQKTWKGNTNLSKKGLTLHVLLNFYPYLQTFLHGLIHKIHDISQLWSNISKTL